MYIRQYKVMIDSLQSLGKQATNRGIGSSIELS